MAKPEGRHPSNRYSALQVQRMKMPGRYCDGNGLYLVVEESGAKRWVLRTTVQRRVRELGLGGLSWVSLAEARDKASALRKTARTGGDPFAEKRRAQGIPIFRDAATLVHEQHKASWRNEKHAAQWISTLKTYAFPEIGDTRIDQIDSAAILRVLSPIWASKRETAVRVRGRISTVMQWAMASGYRSDDPTRSVGKALPKGRPSVGHMTAMPYAEVPAFIKSLRAFDGAGELTRLALEFTILTGVRTGEVIGAPWAEFNGDTWTIPAARMKSGHEHRVPLSARALTILDRIREFGMEASGPFPLSNMTMLMALRRMFGTAEAPTVHGFRSTFRDWTAEQTATPHDVVEMALAHTIKDKVVAAYKRTDLFEKRRVLMSTWAEFCCGEEAQK